MRVKRVFIVPAILALSVAGSILAGSSGHVAVAPATSTHAVAATHYMD